MRKMRTIGTRAPHLSVEERPQVYWKLFRHLTPGAPAEFPSPEDPENVSEVSYPAHLSASRWMVDGCCNASQETDPEAPFFLCTECWNKKLGGKLARVEFPDPIMRGAIEREAGKFSNPMRANWFPGWDLEQVKLGRPAVGGPSR